MPKALVRFLAILLIPCLLADPGLSLSLPPAAAPPAAETLYRTQAFNMVSAWFRRLPWFVRARKMGSEQAGINTPNPGSPVRKSRPKKLILRTAVTMGVAAALVISAYAWRGFQTVLTNPTFRGFWMQDPNTLEPSVQAFIQRTDPSFWRYLEEDFLYFTPEVRQRIIAVAPVDLFDIVNLVRFPQEFEMENEAVRRYPPEVLAELETKFQWHRSLWQALSGKPYSIETVVRDYAEEGGAFALTREQYGRPVTGKELFYNIVGDDIKDPADRAFILRYVEAGVRRQQLPAITLMSRLFEMRALLPTVPQDLLTPQSREDFTLSFLGELYSMRLTTRFRQEVFEPFGGFHDAMVRASTDPNLESQILDRARQLADLVEQTYFASDPPDYAQNWSQQDFLIYLQGVEKMRQVVAPIMYRDAVNESMAELADAGFMMTPDVPTLLAEPSTSGQLIQRWMGDLLPRQNGQFTIPNAAAFTKYVRVRRVMLAQQRDFVVDQEINLTSIRSITDLLEMAEILNQATSVDPAFAGRVAEIFKAQYGAIPLPTPEEFKEANDLRRALITLYLLETFQAADPAFTKYEDYQRLFAALPPDLLVGLSNGLTLADARWLAVFYSETAAQNPKTATAVLTYFIREKVFPEIDFSDLRSVERLRLTLNEQAPTVGDQFLVLFAEAFADRYPITESTVDFHHKIVTLWLAAEFPEANRDIQQLYRLVGNFIGNNLVDYLVADPSRRQRYSQTLNDLRTAGIDFPLAETWWQRLDTDLVKLSANLWSGNLRYLAEKAAVRQASGPTVEVRQNAEWQLPRGFQAQRVFDEQGQAADLIVGDPALDARVLTAFDVGYLKGGVTANSIGFSEGQAVPVADFPVAFTTGNGKPTDFAMVRGEVLNWVMSPTYNHGLLIVYRDGTAHIGDKRQLRLSELYRDPARRPREDRVLNLRRLSDFWLFISIARQEQLSFNGNMLLLNGEEMTEIHDGTDQRRLLLEFPDGRIGLLNLSRQMSTFDATRIAKAVGAVRAMYCDTGYYDYTTVHTLNAGPILLGHSDNAASSNRVFFYQAQRDPKTGETRDFGIQVRSPGLAVLFLGLILGSQLGLPAVMLQLIALGSITFHVGHQVFPLFRPYLRHLLAVLALLAAASQSDSQTLFAAAGMGSLFLKLPHLSTGEGVSSKGSSNAPSRWTGVGDNLRGLVIRALQFKPLESESKMIEAWVQERTRIVNLSDDDLAAEFDRLSTVLPERFTPGVSLPAWLNDPAKVSKTLDDVESDLRSIWKFLRYWYSLPKKPDTSLWEDKRRAGIVLAEIADRQAKVDAAQTGIESVEGVFRILIADDEQKIRAYHRGILSSVSPTYPFTRFEILEAESGERALAYYLEGESLGKPVHSVLADGNMGRMSGYALAKEIRKVERNRLGRTGIPILLISRDLDPSQALEAEITHSIQKDELNHGSLVKGALEKEFAAQMDNAGRSGTGPAKSLFTTILALLGTLPALLLPWYLLLRDVETASPGWWVFNILVGAAGGIAVFYHARDIRDILRYAPPAAGYKDRFVVTRPYQEVQINFLPHPIGDRAALHEILVHPLARRLWNHPLLRAIVGLLEDIFIAPLGDPLAQALDQFWKREGKPGLRPEMRPIEEHALSLAGIYPAPKRPRVHFVLVYLVPIAVWAALLAAMGWLPLNLDGAQATAFSAAGFGFLLPKLPHLGTGENTPSGPSADELKEIQALQARFTEAAGVDENTIQFQNVSEEEGDRLLREQVDRADPFAEGDPDIEYESTTKKNGQHTIRGALPVAQLSSGETGVWRVRIRRFWDPVRKKPRITVLRWGVPDASPVESYILPAKKDPGQFTYGRYFRPAEDQLDLLREQLRSGNPHQEGVFKDLDFVTHTDDRGMVNISVSNGTQSGHAALFSGDLVPGFVRIQRQWDAASRQSRIWMSRIVSGRLVRTELIFVPHPSIAETYSLRQPQLSDDPVRQPIVDQIFSEDPLKQGYPDVTIETRTNPAGEVEFKKKGKKRIVLSTGSAAEGPVTVQRTWDAERQVYVFSTRRTVGTKVYETEAILKKKGARIVFEQVKTSPDNERLRSQLRSPDALKREGFISLDYERMTDGSGVLAFFVGRLDGKGHHATLTTGDSSSRGLARIREVWDEQENEPRFITERKAGKKTVKTYQKLIPHAHMQGMWDFEPIRVGDTGLRAIETQMHSENPHDPDVFSPLDFEAETTVMGRIPIDGSASAISLTLLGERRCRITRFFAPDIGGGESILKVAALTNEGERIERFYRMVRSNNRWNLEVVEDVTMLKVLFRHSPFGGGIPDIIPATYIMGAQLLRVQFESPHPLEAGHPNIRFKLNVNKSRWVRLGRHPHSVNILVDNDLVGSILIERRYVNGTYQLILQKEDGTAQRTFTLVQRPNGRLGADAPSRRFAGVRQPRPRSKGAAVVKRPGRPISEMTDAEKERFLWTRAARFRNLHAYNHFLVKSGLLDLVLKRLRQRVGYSFHAHERMVDPLIELLSTDPGFKNLESLRFTSMAAGPSTLLIAWLLRAERDSVALKYLLRVIMTETDGSADMLKAGKTLREEFRIDIPVQGVVSLLHQQPIATGSQDVAEMALALNELPDRDAQIAALQEAYRITRPGGLIVLLEPPGIFDIDALREQRFGNQVRWHEFESSAADPADADHAHLVFIRKTEVPWEAEKIAQLFAPEADSKPAVGGQTEPRDYTGEVIDLHANMPRLNVHEITPGPESQPTPRTYRVWWIAAGAAALLIVGLAAGHLVFGWFDEMMNWLFDLSKISTDFKTPSVPRASSFQLLAASFAGSFILPKFPAVRDFLQRILKPRTRRGKLRALINQELPLFADRMLRDREHFPPERKEAIIQYLRTYYELDLEVMHIAAVAGTELSVGPKFFALSDTEQRGSLWHEWTHQLYGLRQTKTDIAATATGMIRYIELSRERGLPIHSGLFPADAFKEARSIMGRIRENPGMPLEVRNQLLTDLLVDRREEYQREVYENGQPPSIPENFKRSTRLGVLALEFLDVPYQGDPQGLVYSYLAELGLGKPPIETFDAIQAIADASRPDAGKNSERGSVPQFLKEAPFILTSSLLVIVGLGFAAPYGWTVGISVGVVAAAITALGRTLVEKWMGRHLLKPRTPRENLRAMIQQEAPLFIDRMLRDRLDIAPGRREKINHDLRTNFWIKPHEPWTARTVHHMGIELGAEFFKLPEVAQRAVLWHEWVHWLSYQGLITTDVAATAMGMIRLIELSNGEVIPWAFNAEAYKEARSVLKRIREDPGMPPEARRRLLADLLVDRANEYTRPHPGFSLENYKRSTRLGVLALEFWKMPYHDDLLGLAYRFLVEISAGRPPIATFDAIQAFADSSPSDADSKSERGSVPDFLQEAPYILAGSVLIIAGLGFAVRYGWTGGITLAIVAIAIAALGRTLVERFPLRVSPRRLRAAA